MKERDDAIGELEKLWSLVGTEPKEREINLYCGYIADKIKQALTVLKKPSLVEELEKHIKRSGNQHIVVFMSPEDEYYISSVSFVSVGEKKYKGKTLSEAITKAIQSKGEVR
jgi:hypothetical protein